MSKKTPSYNEKALERLHEMMRGLGRLEADEFKLLTAKWNVVIGNLGDLIKELSEKELKTENELLRLKTYKEFLIESSAQVKKYDEIASGIILDNQFKYSELAVNATNEIIDMVGVRFNRLSPRSINAMIGLTRDSSPLFELLNKSYPKTVDKIVNTLITSQALGRGPRETARLMSEAMGGNRTRALLIARTEQMRANREASLQAMKESKVCSGWQRIEQDDACDECKEENGKRYPLSESFDTHPNCRGALLPLVGG